MRVLPLVMLAAMLFGCATLSERDTTTRLAIQYATLKALDTDVERAQDLRRLVDEARDYIDSGATVTVAFFDSQVRQRINWTSMNLADQLLIDAVLIEARAMLEKQVGEGLLDADQRLKMRLVLDWIDNAALMVR